MDREAWRATVHRVTNSRKWLKHTRVYSSWNSLPLNFSAPQKCLLSSFIELSSLGYLFPISQSRFPDALSGFTYAPFPPASGKPHVYHKWWQVLSQCQTSNTGIYQTLAIPSLWGKDLHDMASQMVDGRGRWGCFMASLLHHPNSTWAFFTQDWQLHCKHHRA